ncbi:MAG: citrate synthase [Phycisphaerae bacterium]|jgi:2-methylcitrate synthase/citrate synthase II|nr:citrate synthase [Phycisphaerae bacterium]MBT5364933.1 citrate synthase [Phycisphaerae bacterium]
MAPTEEKAPAKANQEGLAGQVIGETSVCAVNQTQLMYRGYEIADLAANATFEEVAHLLLIGHKPTPEELTAFKAELVSMRGIPNSVKDTIIHIAKNSPEAHPMGVLRTAVSLLSHICPVCEDNSTDADLRKSMYLLAQIPTCIGVHQMALDGKTPVDPDPNLDHAANLLWCMSGEVPHESAAKVMDVSLILYAEHDFNASTFTSRVVASTNSDLHSCVCGGIGALKGNLHGGANEAAMEMLKEIMESVEGGSTAEAYMQHAFETKKKLMGFGHRVYKNGDHRAGILRDWGLKYADSANKEAKKWFDLGDEVQAIMLRDKDIHPNVDFPCGMTYFAMGIPVPQYTPIFVVARITGWCAHIMEQHQNNRIIRPLAHYAGEELRTWND